MLLMARFIQPVNPLNSELTVPLCEQLYRRTTLFVEAVFLSRREWRETSRHDSQFSLSFISRVASFPLRSLSRSLSAPSRNFYLAVVLAQVFELFVVNFDLVVVRSGLEKVFQRILSIVTAFFYVQSVLQCYLKTGR